MSVNATCGKCNSPLVNDNLKLEDGKQVQISKCPNDHGKIKSPCVVVKIWFARPKILIILESSYLKRIFFKASIDSTQAFAAGIVVK